MAVSANVAMDSLVAKMNQVQDVFQQAGLSEMKLNLPQFIVVGAQSAGKSSVLENFVGRSFLPRGGDIVTRRPLVLQMVHDANNEYGEFLHDKTRKYDFDEIAEEIEEETERMAPGDCVSAEPINLRIRSPHTLNFTLMDLPGLTLVPTDTQPADIEQQIRAIVMKYAEQDNALILAISPANVDLANSAALKLAKEVDPQGLRTTSVITKMDLMAPDTNASLILSNKLLKLKHGHWGVVNTSREAEKKFFANHAAYRDPDIAKQCGTPNLQTALVAQLQMHIRDRLPDLQEDLRTRRDALAVLVRVATYRLKSEITRSFHINRLSSCKKQVRKYKSIVELKTLASKSKVLQEITTQLSSSFECNIEATGGGSANIYNDATLNCGAEISNIFHVKFRKNLEEICSFVEKNDGTGKKLDEKIAYVIRNSHGIRSIVFPHQRAFEKIASNRIALLQEPCACCVDKVVKQLRDTFTQLLDEASCNAGRYPKLRSEIKRRFESYLDERQTIVKDAIFQFVEIQTMYFNTNNKDFVKVEDIVDEKDCAQQETRCETLTSSRHNDRIVYMPRVNSDCSVGSLSISSGNNNANISAATPNSANDSQVLAKHVRKVRIMLQSYTKIVQWNLYENIPKYIFKLLINDLIDNYLKVDLPSQLYAAVAAAHYFNKKTAVGKRGGTESAESVTNVDDDNSDDDSDADIIVGLMDEDPEMVEKRKETLHMFKAITEALRIVESAFL